MGIVWLGRRVRVWCMMWYGMVGGVVWLVGFGRVRLVVRTVSN